MDDLKLKLNPLTKFKVYKAARKILFTLLDRKHISPERLDEIMQYVVVETGKISTPEDAAKFSAKLVGRYPELAAMKEIFENESAEKVDQVIGLLVENLIAKGNFELAEKIIDEVHELEKLHGGNVDELRNLAPEEFELAVKRILGN